VFFFFFEHQPELNASRLAVLDVEWALYEDAYNPSPPK